MDDENRKYALERFLEVTAEHKMEILLDNGTGLYRHLKFTKNGSSIYRFDIHTWPGFLCICGDMGTYVFQRVLDMFTFFRSVDSELRINPRYWAEKCQAAGREGIEEYVPEMFMKRINEWMDENEFSYGAKIAVSNVLPSYSDDGEHEAIRAAMDFKYEGKYLFPDFYEVKLRDWTHHYLWCCYAIVWGIQQYDSDPKTHTVEGVE